LGGDGGGGSWYFAHGLDYGIREKKNTQKRKKQGGKYTTDVPPSTQIMNPL